MKRTLLFILLLIAIGQLKSQSVTTGNVTGPLCAGTSVNVPFTTTGSFNTDLFSAELSDASGGFDQPVTIVLYYSIGGSIYVTIPVNTVAGTHYRIRVLSISPIVHGSDNGTDITITAAAAAPNVSVSGQGCATIDSLTASNTPGALQLNWYANSSNYITTVAYAGATVAGGNDTGHLANQFNGPSGVSVDAQGNIYVSDVNNNRVQKFPSGSTSLTNGVTVAGGNGAGSDSNQLARPLNLYVDGSGNIYVVDGDNNRIQKFAAGSTSASKGVTVAGGNGPGSAANQLNSPDGVWLDSYGNIYVADYINNRVQKFPPNSTRSTNGITVAGGNGAGSAANQFNGVDAVFIDNANNLFVADAGGRIQKFPYGSDSTTNGITVAGNNGYGLGANQLYYPAGVFVDITGNIYVADYNHRILKFPAGSNSSTNGITVATGITPGEVFVDATGNVYEPDQAVNAIIKYAPVALKHSETATAPGSYWVTYTTASGCASLPSDTVIIQPSSTSVSLLSPTSICKDAPTTINAAPVNGGTHATYQWVRNGLSTGTADSFYITSALRNNDVVSVIITSNAVCAAGDTASASVVVKVHDLPAAPVISVSGPACAGYDSLAITATAPDRITWNKYGLPVDSFSSAVTVAGTGVTGNTATQLKAPYDVAVDNNGNIYVADEGNNRVQKFAPGSLTGVTVAAKGLVTPSSVAVDGDGNLYVADQTSSVLKYPAGSDANTAGIVVAGGGGLGNGANQLSNPFGICLDGQNNLYVTDLNNARVQKYAAGSNSNSSGTTVAQAGLLSPAGVFVDNSGNIYVADYYYLYVTRYPANSNALTTGIEVARTGLTGPSDVYLDATGHIYVVDNNTGRVLKFIANSNSATTGTVIMGDGGIGSAFNQLNSPFGAYVAPDGTIYVADQMNNRVQKYVPGSPGKQYVPADGGNYSASYVNQFGCSSAQSQAIAVHDRVLPVVTQVNNNTLTTDQFASYQWLNFGIPVADSTAQSFSFTNAGRYSVRVTDINGCTDTSNAISIVLGIHSPGAEAAVRLYPNPNTGMFIVDAAAYTGSELLIYDIAGALVHRQIITTAQQTIRADYLAAGTYTLQIKNATTNGVGRFTISK